MPNIRVRARSNLAASTALASLSRPANDPDRSLELAIDYVDPETLIPPPRKLRVNNARQMASLRASIREFGFLNPILVDEDDAITGCRIIQRHMIKTGDFIVRQTAPRKTLKPWPPP